MVLEMRAGDPNKQTRPTRGPQMDAARADAWQEVKLFGYATE